MVLEAVVLTGGASRRMGQDKASLPIHGVPQAERIVSALRARHWPVTVLGREPIAGADFLADAEAFAGPAVALARFEPCAELVFVASCDLPRFDADIVPYLKARLADHQAAVPVVDAFRQPLCALYRATAWSVLQTVVAEGRRCPTRWIERLDCRLVNEEELLEHGIDPGIARGANTPEELRDALSESSTEERRRRFES